MPNFFPNLSFGWTFYGVLIAFLIVAATIDSRRMVVPKWVSLSIMALGAVFNLVRGGWLGGKGLEVWIFEPKGVLTGAADGFLFALVGFLTGFGIFFVLWVLGICGGGDVKLFAAVSAWVGPEFSLWILALTTIILFVLLVLKLAFTIITTNPQASPLPRADKKSKVGKTRDSRQARGMTYALPLALATAIVLLWVFRADLNLLIFTPSG